MSSQSASGHRALVPAATTSSNGRANEASEANDVELDRIQSTDNGVKLPLHEDLMQLAMLGELGPIQKLLDEGRYAITHKDEEGITPLHVRDPHSRHSTQ